MNKKDLYDSLEKERDRMLDEDERFQNSSERLSLEKEREILGKTKSTKASWFRSKKFIGLAAVVAIILFASPLILLLPYNRFMASSSDMNMQTAHVATPDEKASSEELGYTEDSMIESSSQAQGPEIFEVLSDEDKKIVYTFEYNIETKEYRKSLEGLEAKAEKFGGFVESSEFDNSSRDFKSINMTLRIPKENSEKFQESLGNIGSVTYQSLSTNDMSKAYSDLDKQVKILETKDARYIELLESAENMEDILAIESQLAEVEAQLRFINQDLKNIDYDVNYNTFHIYLYEVENPDIGVNEKDSFTNRLKRAFSYSFENFKNFIQNLVLFIASNIIFIGLITLIVILVFWLVKKRR